MYPKGLTEVGGIVLRGGPDSEPGSCGTVLPNVSIKVIDTETGKILGPNQIGEAWIRSPNMMSCYYNNPKETKAMIDSEGKIQNRLKNSNNSNINV